MKFLLVGPIVHPANPFITRVQQDCIHILCSAEVYPYPWISSNLLSNHVWPCMRQLYELTNLRKIHAFPYMSYDKEPTRRVQLVPTTSLALSDSARNQPTFYIYMWVMSSS